MKRHQFIDNIPLLHVAYCPVCTNQLATGNCHCALFEGTSFPFGAFQRWNNIEMREVSLVDNLPEGDLNRLRPLTRADLVEARNAIERADNAT